MALNTVRSHLVVLCLALAFPSFLHAQSGSIAGRVTDASDKTPLWGANVMVKGTTIGAVTDAEGRFRLQSVATGTAVLLVRYLGYTTDSIRIAVKAGATSTVESRLTQEVLRGREVVVTAQLQGQQAAINQQLSSNTIVNIVSADKIQALPDANVAESISRLSGISIQRDAGEGSKIVVRGLSPKFNSVTIDGERIPATDANDRSVDLSMISQDILAGIEVFKALTADKDADAVGGTVNLVTKKAPNDLRVQMVAQGGYNSFANDYGVYKFSFSGSDRFFEDRFGMLATITSQRANRSSDVLNAGYKLGGTNLAPTTDISDLYLIHRNEIRDRWSAGLNFDYALDDGLVSFHNFFSQLDRDEVRRRKAYRVDALRTEYDLRAREITTNVFTTSLHGQYALGGFNLNGQAAFSRSLQNTPHSTYARFQELSSMSNTRVTNQGPSRIPEAALNDLSHTWYQYGTYNAERVNDYDKTALLDATYPFSWSDDLTGYVKAGGRYRDKTRNKNTDEFRTDFGVTDTIGRLNAGKFARDQQGHILISNFIDPGFSPDNFLNGDYVFGPGLQQQGLEDFRSAYESFYERNRFIDLSDYDAYEKITAAYAMAELKILESITFIPGIRYEKTINGYHGKFGRLGGNLGQSGAIRDTTGERTYEDYFPMIHLRWKAFEGFDVRLAYTKSLSRPDYFNLVPFQQISDGEKLISEGNPDLLRTGATNYDCFLSFYNRYGLFTVGGYYKKLKNIDYLSVYRVTSGPFNSYTKTQPVNSPEGKVYGLELDAQANFLFFPEPFDGIILSANISRIYSETYFPYFEIGPRSTEPPFAPIIINTFRKARLPGQADWIYNVTLGYEKGGFSGRVSAVHQGKILQTVGVRSELDGYTDAFTRFDASVSQSLVGGLSLFANMNNINNIPDGAFVGEELFPSITEYFGWSVDLGLKFKF